MKAKNMARAARTVVFSAMLAAAATAASAAEFPGKPVRLVVPFPPGGALDTTARLIAGRLQEGWKQSVIVENRPGAAGTIGVDHVAKSAPDGYTLVINAWSLSVATPHLQRTPYDATRDLEPVVQTAVTNFVLAANPALGVSTIAELVELARKEPRRLNYASAGNGSGMHLYSELVKGAAKIHMTHVPYKGEGPAVQALLSGEVNLLFGTTAPLMPFLKTGKVRALLVAGARPLEGLPNVPPMDAVYPGLSIEGWHGMFAPAGTPKAVIDRVAADVRTAVLSPELTGRFRQMGFEATGVPAGRFAEIVRRDYERWGQVIRENNIRAD